MSKEPLIYKNAELYNIAELLPSPDGQGVLATRIPDTLRQKLNPNAQANAMQCAGAEIRFNLIGDMAEITLETVIPNPWKITHPVIEVYNGNFLTKWKVVGPEATTILIARSQFHELSQDYNNHDLPFDNELCRFILPYRPSVKLLDIKGDITPPRPGQTPEVKYLSYGSSITHGFMAIRPTESWAMQTAESFGVDLINLGFGGGAHLEPEMADYIAQRDDWNFATLEMGINVLDSISSEEFAKRVDYFVERIAKAHPDKWIFCIDMFMLGRPEHLQAEEEKQFRKIVADKVNSMNMPRLVHVSGLDLLNKIQGLSADMLHPSPVGMKMIADNLCKIMRAKGIV